MRLSTTSQLILVLILLVLMLLVFGCASIRTTRSNYRNSTLVRPVQTHVKPYTPFLDKVKY